ncbi:aspartyl protease domain-containing protein [Trichoderma ceciliae]
MSPSCAEACGIMRLVDKRFAGVARGVGTATIIGRVHSAQIKIGNLFLPCSFTVMEGKSVELLLGLDMLKRYQAHIDLETDKLIIQGQEISFLGEAEIPKEEETIIQEPTIPGPAGTAIGQRSGAVIPAGDAPSQTPSQTPSQAPSQTPSHPAPDAPPQVPAQAPPPQPVASAQSSAPEAGVTPAHIDNLVSMGATREQAIQALRAAEDNVDMAASLIFF